MGLGWHLSCGISPSLSLSLCALWFTWHDLCVKPYSEFPSRLYRPTNPSLVARRVWLASEPNPADRPTPDASTPTRSTRKANHGRCCRWRRSRTPFIASLWSDRPRIGCRSFRDLLIGFRRGEDRTESPNWWRSWPIPSPRRRSCLSPSLAAGLPPPFLWMVNIYRGVIRCVFYDIFPICPPTFDIFDCPTQRMNKKEKLRKGNEHFMNQPFSSFQFTHLFVLWFLQILLHF